jgi:hypothetical protein
MKAGLAIRKKCLDPIPVCGKICGKTLPCGGGGIDGQNNHTCTALCHLEQLCPPCNLITTFKCRCLSKKFELNCAQYDPTKEYRCEKRCTKKKRCGRHKCTTKCCIDEDHICYIVCDRFVIIIIIIVCKKLTICLLLIIDRCVVGFIIAPYFVITVTVRLVELSVSETE